jgi:hypothetical protein
VPISLTISDLHAEFHDLAVSMGYIRAAEVPAIVAAFQRAPVKHDMQVKPLPVEEEQPAEKFEAPAEPEKKPRGRPRKQAEPFPTLSEAHAAPEVTVQDVVVAEVEKLEEFRYSLADVTQALRNIVKTHSYKEEPARKLLSDYGISKISELPVEKYAAFIKDSADRCEAAPK